MVKQTIIKKINFLLFSTISFLGTIVLFGLLSIAVGAFIVNDKWVILPAVSIGALVGIIFFYLMIKKLNNLKRI